MRASVVKSLRREVMEYARKKGLSGVHAKSILKSAKKDYNKTPRTKRNKFTIYES